MKPHLSIRILIAFNLLVGLLTFSNYGESWDVNSLTHYAQSSLSMYGRLTGNGSLLSDSLADELALGNYGPAYMMLVQIINRLASPLIDAHRLQHLIYFVTFQAGVVAFYLLCLRWMNEYAAFGATLLFSTQPVLWGHAFINPKDIPFLAFFLLTIWSGFRIADSLQPISLDKRILVSSTAFWLIPFLILFFGSGLILAWIENAVHAAAAGGTNIISFIASDVATTPPAVYIEKYSNLYVRTGFFFVLVSTIALLFLYRRYSRSTFSALTPVLLAAVLLGFTISIRNLGIFAGLIVTMYILWKHGRTALPHLLVYGLFSAVVVYLLWPYLWTNPIGHLVESVLTMSRYPWTGTVLFNGVNYSAGELPASYLPTLLGIQLTEPVWALFIVGLTAAIIGWREKRGLLVLFLVWFVLPLVGFILARTILYDNFRQVLFILPPVFFMAGLAFEKIKRPLIQAVVIALCVLPGLIGILKLHPYEYIYYNSFIGGVNGASEKFELDYWGTSYREAALYVNDAAPPNANIWVEGPAQIFGVYARQDLHIYSTNESTRADDYDYVVTTTRYNLDETSHPDTKIIYAVTRGDAVLSVIKQP